MAPAWPVLTADKKFFGKKILLFISMIEMVRDCNRNQPEQARTPQRAL
jgi:hypothetical protein